MRAEEVAKRALSLDKRTPFAHHAMGKRPTFRMLTEYFC